MVCRIVFIAIYLLSYKKKKDIRYVCECVGSNCKTMRGCQRDTGSLFERQPARKGRGCAGRRKMELVPQ